MRKVFCLGLHKTGSTSLQQFLLANQIALAHAGVLVPPVTPEGQARFIAEALGRLPARHKLRINEYMGHNALAYRMMTESVPGFALPPVHAPMADVETVLAGVRDLAALTRAQTLILCSEDLARASLAAPDMPARLVDAFGSEDTTLFCIIRRPDQAIAAWQSQRLRFGQPFARLYGSGLREYLGTVHLEYRAALAPWLRHFPKARLVILPYGAVRAGGGAVAAFRALPGLDLPGGLADVADANRSLPLALIEIARTALDALPPDAARALRYYLAGAARRLDLPPNGAVDMLGAPDRNMLMGSFDETHHWLSQITGRIPFFADYDRILEIPAQTDREAATALLPAVQADAQRHLKDAEALRWLARLTRAGFADRA